MTVETIVEPIVETVVSTVVETATDINEVVPPVTETVVPPVTETGVKKEIMIPKERFDEVNGKYKELAGQMEALVTSNKTMESKLAEMEKAGASTTETINATTEQLTGQVKQYEALMNQMVESKMKAVPEAMQDLIPEGLGMEQKLAWLNKAEEKGLFKKAQIEVGKPLNHSSNQDVAERVKKMNPLQSLLSHYSTNKQ